MMLQSPDQLGCSRSVLSANHLNNYSALVDDESAMWPFCFLDRCGGAAASSEILYQSICPRRERQQALSGSNNTAPLSISISSSGYSNTRFVLKLDYISVRVNMSRKTVHSKITKSKAYGTNTAVCKPTFLTRRCRVRAPALASGMLSVQVFVFRVTDSDLDLSAGTNLELGKAA